MILIDGSEAGGQVLRTASALSALTGKPFKITNIRGARPEPGLKTQHIEGLKAIADICNATVNGLELCSEEIEFIPGKIEIKPITINISTAGSIGLVLQSLSIIAAGLGEHENIHVDFNGGGTWNQWAPPVIYLKEVFNSFINIFTIEIRQDGFYPKGGAKVSATIDRYDMKKIEINESEKLKKIEIYSIASSHLKRGNVADRQAAETKRLLEAKFGVPIIVRSEYVESLSPGSGILIVAKTDNSTFGADSLGDRNKSSEDVAKEAVKNFVAELDGSVDRHMADMLLPFMALSGGSIRTSQITQHIITNIEVIEKFLDVKFVIIGEKGMPGTITVNRL